LQEHNHDQLRRALTHYLGCQLTPEVAATIECFARSNPMPMPHPGVGICVSQAPAHFAAVNGALEGNWTPAADRVIASVAEDGALRAVTAFSPINRYDVEMSIAALRGDWATRAFVRACFRYAFDTLKAERVTGRVAASNRIARDMDERLGFRIEGRQARGFGADDAVIYGMTRGECRWL
jgi:hypothetical protein